MKKIFNRAQTGTESASSKIPVRTSAYGTRYVLVTDLFLDPDVVSRMERAARRPQRLKDEQLIAGCATTK